MEFWPENQGPSPLYAKYGTIPGRSANPNYHERHQLYYSDQQDQLRESSYWTGPGPRREQFSPWMDPEPSTAAHLPFLVDRYSHQRQDVDQYHPHEARGFLRDGWQRRWEPCGAARYSREASAKRSDSSYRELEAWAARYCHSLPRRRRLEAELRGASQSLLDGGRAPGGGGRSGSDPRGAALQQVRPSANRESGAWETGGRCYPTQAPGKSNTLDIKDHQRKAVSHPPGYAAPPSYYSPRKGSPVTQHCDSSWKQDAGRQTLWSQPPLRKEASAELESERRDESPTWAELVGRKRSHDLLQSPISIQTTATQQKLIKAVQETNGQTTPKIIEGRKFSLKRKTGGMTVFCLVSRIAGVTETQPGTLCISQTNLRNDALTEVSEGSQDRSDNRLSLADEPDCTAQSYSCTTTNVQQGETQIYTEGEMLRDENLNERKNLTDENSKSGKESNQQAPVKYPLWRQPSFTNRVETGNSSTLSLEVDCKEGEPASGLSPEDELKRPGIKTKSEKNDEHLLVDSSCVLVKMELIPSPKKEHVHYVDHTQPEHLQSTASPEANDQDTTTDPNTENRTLFRTNDESAAEPTSSAAETLEERAQRILGISLDDCITEEQPVQELDPSPVGTIPEDTAEEEQNRSEVGPSEEFTRLNDRSTNEDSKDGARSQEEPCDRSEADDVDLQDIQLEATSAGSETQQGLEDNQHFRSSEELPQSPEPPDDSHVPESREEQSPDPELAALDDDVLAGPTETSALPPTLLEHLPPPLPLGSTESSPASTPCSDQLPSPPLPPPSPLSPNIIDQTLEATPVITMDHEDSNRVLGEVTAELTSESSRNDRSEDPACVEESSSSAEQEPEDADSEQRSVEDSDCVKQNHVTGEEAQKEPGAVLLEMKTQPEDMIDSPPKSQEDGEEETFYTTQSREDQTQTDLSGHLEPTRADAHADVDLLEDTEPHTEPSGLDWDLSPPSSDVLSCSEAPSLSCLSDTESHSQKSETDSLCPPTLNPHPADGASSESLYLTMGSPSDSPSSSAPPSLEEAGSISLDFPHKDEPQCPLSLWDAVNRIRKHTAPDSEDEEDEAGEPWDPESLGGGFPGEAEGGTFTKEVSDEEAQLEERVEDVDVHEEQSGLVEDDTLSCSSTTSHSSEDTVIVAEVQETRLDAETETDEGSHEAEAEEGCCS